MQPPMVKADSGFDGPVDTAAVLYRELENADAIVVKGSVAHRKCRRRGEHPGSTCTPPLTHTSRESLEQGDQS